MKVIITGGAGRVGQYVVKEFAAAGHEVVVFDQTRPQELTSGVTYRLGSHEDLGQIVELTPGADAIVHLSAIPYRGLWPNTTVFRTNVMGNFNVHEAAVITGVPLVVSTSSQSAYGFAYEYRSFLPLYLPLDEEHPLLSQDSYGLSKVVGEEIAHGYHRRSGLRVCSMRPPWVALPEDFTPNMLKQIREPEEWHPMLFSYLHVRDLAVAFRMVVEAPADVIQDEVFNLAADDAFADEPLAELLPRFDPAFKEMAAQLTGNQSMMNTERIKQKLGWKPQYSWRDLITSDA